jgi:hypothetical protein
MGDTARAVAAKTGRVEALLQAAATRAEQDGLGDAEGAILAAVAELGALGKVARRFGVTRAAVQAWIRTDPDRLRSALAEARRDAGEVKAEDAGEHFDDLGDDPSTAQVQVARERSNYDRWLAGVWNEQYRQDRGVKVAVGVGLAQLHLDALRAEGVRRAPVVVVEVEATSPGEDGGEALEAELDEAGLDA